MGLEHENMGAGMQRAEVPSRTVVVGFDGSELARAALALARRRAGPSGKVVAVYAAPPVPEVVAGLPTPVPPPPQPVHVKIGKRILQDIGDEQTSTRQVSGYPAKALV